MPFDFVDVSGMTLQEVKQMNQQDEPSSKAQGSTRRPAPVEINTVLAFEAAAVAHRINQGEYVKAGSMVQDVSQGPGFFIPNPKITNRDIMKSVLSGTIAVTESDKDLAREVMLYFKGLTLKLLANKPVNDFELRALRLSQSASMREYDLGVVACLPSSYQRAQRRDADDQRLTQAAGGFIGQLGQRVTVKVDVVRSVYSQQWQTWYISGVTDQDQAVFFSLRNGLDSNVKTVLIQGHVRAHRDHRTQLNRVKVISC